MANPRRKSGKKQFNDLKRIEGLLESAKQPPINQKEQLIEKVKKIQEVHKEAAESIPYLPCPHKQIKITSVNPSDHSLMRATERLTLAKTSKDEVTKFLHKQLASSTYIGRVVSEEGSESELFVKGKIRFHLNTGLDTIITVINIGNKSRRNPFNYKVASLLLKEFRKLDRKECATLRKLENYTYDANVQIAECKRRIHHTKSEAVKLSCKGRIVALEQELETLQSEIETIRVTKRNTAYSIAEVV